MGDMRITVGDLIAYLQGNCVPQQPVVLTESWDAPEDAVVLADVLQGIREEG